MPVFRHQHYLTLMILRGLERLGSRRVSPFVAEITIGGHNLKIKRSRSFIPSLRDFFLNHRNIFSLDSIPQKAMKVMKFSVFNPDLNRFI